MTPRARSALVIGIAAALVAAAAVVFMTVKPGEPEKTQAEPPPAWSAEEPAPRQKPAAPRRAEAPREENLPGIFNLSAPEKCLLVEGGVYEGNAAPAIARGRIPALYIYNACREPRVFSDVKTSPTHVSYVYSRLPLKAVLRDPHNPASRGKDRLILFDRAGEKCDALEVPAEACRFVPLPVRHVLIVPMTERLHFAVQLKDRRRIEGYLAPPRGAPPRQGPPLKSMKGN